jgi:hypothetical protein
VRGELITTQESDVFDKQTRQPFPFASGRARISPEPRKIGYQVQDGLALLL